MLPFLKTGQTHKVVVNGEVVHFGTRRALEYWVEKNERPGVNYNILPVTTKDIIDHCDPFDLEADIYYRYPSPKE